MLETMTEEVGDLRKELGEKDANIQMLKELA